MGIILIIKIIFYLFFWGKNNYFGRYGNEAAAMLKTKSIVFLRIYLSD